MSNPHEQPRTSAMPNRLINETSPYLLQHAHNPVDWYPWGPEALERARSEDMPILLSVGYSACHWCHVMERESFENEDIAALMNESFVSIKVDREERPDLDSIYMTAVQAMTGQGGWPMTVFLTPDGRPFYGGTYFPPEDRGGLPSFPRVVQALARAYRENRGEVVQATQRLVGHIRQVSVGARSREPLTADILHQAYGGIAGSFDDRHGGTGLQPKFPQPMVYEFLLRYHLRFESPGRPGHGRPHPREDGARRHLRPARRRLSPLLDRHLLARPTLREDAVRQRAAGTALPARVPDDAKPLYRRVVEETLDYVAREMTHPSGGFYSAQDADSEGVEGKFFVWRPEEITDILGKEAAEVVNRVYGVTRTGNFEGHSILHVAEPAEKAAEELGMAQPELEALLQQSKAALLRARESRVRPARDDKVLTSWNGLMLRAFAEAGTVLDRPDYISYANQNAKFLLDHLRKGDRLLRTYREPRAALNGYLEDYAFLVDGLITLHEATFDQDWLREAVALGYGMVDLFWDEGEGLWYDTGRDHEALIVRPRDVSDNATPSGASMATDVLLRLAVITGDAELRRRAAESLRSVRDLMSRVPAGAGHWLGALDLYLSSPREIALIGEPAAEETRALAAEVYREYIPNRVFVGAGDAEGAASGVPLLEGRGTNRRRVHRLRLPKLRLRAARHHPVRPRPPARVRLTLLPLSKQAFKKINVFRPEYHRCCSVPIFKLEASFSQAIGSSTTICKRECHLFRR